jgi:O-antigen/teichoic acid export membrane protein
MLRAEGRREDLRRVSLAALVMLVVQFGLGMFLNLYVTVPAADAHAGIMQEIANGPLALTVHATLGLALIVTAVAALVRAVRVEERLVAVLAAAGLTAIGGAFAAGEIFVRNGQNGASLAMALLTAVALLSYVGVLAWTVRGQGAHVVHRNPVPAPAVAGVLV